MSLFSRAIGAVKDTVKSATGGVANVAGQIGRNIDPTSSRGLVGRGIGAVARVPGGGIMVTGATLGLAAKRRDVQQAYMRDTAIGVGIAAGVGGKMLGDKLGAANLASAEAARTPTTSPGDLEAIDAAQANLAGYSAATSPGGLDQIDRAAGGARAPLLAGVGNGQVLLIAGAVGALGLLLWGASKR